MAAIRDIVEAWASFYANSPAARSAVTFTHVGALVVGGGSAIAADLGTIRAMRGDGAAARLAVGWSKRMPSSAGTPRGRWFRSELWATARSARTVMTHSVPQR